MRFPVPAWPEGSQMSTGARRMPAVMTTGRRRLLLAAAAATVALALLATTQLGQAAGRAIAKAVPLAKVANFAKNARKLGGHKASTNLAPTDRRRRLDRQASRLDHPGDLVGQKRRLLGRHRRHRAARPERRNGSYRPAAVPPARATPTRSRLGRASLPGHERDQPGPAAVPELRQGDRDQGREPRQRQRLNPLGERREPARRG